MIDLAAMTAQDVAQSVRQRRLSAVAVAQAALQRIERDNGSLRAFITPAGDQAVESARRVDRRVAVGEDLPLAGVPLAVKDSFWTRGLRATAGSRLLADFVPDEDATVVARLLAAGCVLVGKTSMHELAYGFTNRNPHYGDCKNPWDPARIPGGSSGGNAVALAAGMALAAVGGDTGGSIRLPAALCGVVGLKVTYGRVSRHGGLPLSWTMDTVGPMTRTVGDAAALLRVMAGHDPRDPTSSRNPVPDYPGGLGQGLKGVRLGIPHTGFLEVMEPDVGAAVQEALGVLKAAGARLSEVPFPRLDGAVGAHRAIIFTEASAAHEAWVRTRAAELGDDVRPLLQAGLFLTGAQYLAAQQARRKIIAAYRELWKSFDVLVTPTSPVGAPPIGAGTVVLGGKERPLLRVFLDLTLPFNLTGQPALSIPCGLTGAGLPIGLQLVGRPFEEAMLLRVGAAFQAATNWHTKVPPALGARGAAGRK